MQRATPSSRSRVNGTVHFPTPGQPQTAANILHRLEMDVFPEIGRMPVADINRKDVLAVLRAIEKRGAREVARRMRAECSRIFRFAIGCGYTERDPSAGLANVLLPRQGAILLP